MFFPLPPLDISTALKWISKTNRNALNIFHKEVVVSPNLLKLLLVDFHRLSEYLIKIFKKSSVEMYAETLGNNFTLLMLS